MRSVLVFFSTLLVFFGAAGVALTDSAKEWYDTEGQATLQSFAGSMFPELSEQELEELVIGEPVAAVSIPEDSSDPRRVETEPEYFAAPVTSDDTPIGVLTYHETEITSEGTVVADAYLAERIHSLEEGDTLLFDAKYGSFFILREEQIIPANTDALEYLAGSTTLSSYLDWRKSVADEGPILGDEPSQRNYRPVTIAGIVLALFLTFTLIFTWLRHSPHAPQHFEIRGRNIRPVRFYRRGGNRVNADD